MMPNRLEEIDLRSLWSRYRFLGLVLSHFLSEEGAAPFGCITFPGYSIQVCN